MSQPTHSKYKLNKKGILLIDLSLLTRPSFEELILQQCHELNKDPMLFKIAFIECILHINCLTELVNGIILPYFMIDQHSDCRYRENIQNLFATLNQIKKRKESLLIGIDIDLSTIIDKQLNSSFIYPIKNSKEEELNWNIINPNFISIHINEKLFPKQLPIICDLITNFYHTNPTLEFITCWELSNIFTIKTIKSFILKNNLPMDKIAISTNILELIFEDSDKDIEEVCFEYNQCLKKYVPAAFGIIFEDFLIDSHTETQQFNHPTTTLPNTIISKQTIYKLLNRLHSQSSNYLYKEYHISGVILSEHLLAEKILRFDVNNLGVCQESMISTLKNLREVLLGEYKEENIMTTMESIEAEFEAFIDDYE